MVWGNFAERRNSSRWLRLQMRGFKARNSSGEGEWSESRSLNVLPTVALYAQANEPACDRVELVWLKISFNDEEFRIYRDGTPIGDTATNASSYQDDNVSEGTTYLYTISAIHSGLAAPSRSGSRHHPLCALDGITEILPEASPPAIEPVGPSSPTCARHLMRHPSSRPSPASHRRLAQPALCHLKRTNLSRQ